ncbi:MAG: ABC transporter substrate-binding protein [Gaiellaceae bacterium]
MRAVALAAALAIGAAACGGGSSAPKRKLLPGTLTVGAVLASARDRIIARGARIGAAEVDNVGGVDGRVRHRVVAGPDAAALVRRGARVVLLPCAARDQARAEAALAGRRVLELATCNDRPSARAWPVGPSLADRADALFATLRNNGVAQVALVPGGAGAVLRQRAAAWGVGVAPSATAVVAGGGWDTVPLSRATYGLDELDTTARTRRDGVTFATFGFPVPGTKLDEVYERYRLAYGSRPDGSEVQLGYNAIRVVDDAVDAARSTDPRAVAAALPGLSVGGAGGVLDYPKSGSRQPRADVAVVQVAGGRLDLVRGGRPERP